MLIHHFSSTGRIAIVHNGIIENYTTIRQRLQKDGYKFVSQTDTEVLATFIEAIQKESQYPLEEVVRIACLEIVGTYAIAVIEQDHPTQLIAAKKGGPMVVGIGKA